MGPVTKLNRMPLDSQADRMPQGRVAIGAQRARRRTACVERYRHGQFTRLDG